MARLAKVLKKIFHPSSHQGDDTLQEIAQTMARLIRGDITPQDALIFYQQILLNNNSALVKEIVLAHLSSVHRYMYDYALARADAKAAIAINPESCEARLALAYLAVMEKDAVKGRRLIEQAMEYSGVDSEKISIIKKFVTKLCSSIAAEEFYKIFLKTVGLPENENIDSSNLFIYGKVKQTFIGHQLKVFLETSAPGNLICLIEKDEAGMVKMLSPGRMVHIIRQVGKKNQQVVDNADIFIHDCSIFM